MPELKRLFLKGRMNKDLDERLVPNGEYRDALNIQVGSSEGSDVGAVENILGNQVAKLKKAFPATDWELNSATTNYYGLPLDAECIGAFKDDINDRIFWFITSSTVDCIAEYTNKYGVVRPVLVDTQNILQFSKNNLITGINLIGDYLFFTDNNSEPKKVDVSAGKFGTASFTYHSQYKGRDFIESDITVIKKGPLNAPSFTLSNDARGGGNALTTITHNFSSTQTNLGGLEDPVAVGSTVSNLSLASPCTYIVGDKLLFTGQETNEPELGTYFQIRAEVVARAGVNNLTSTISIKILSITDQVLDDNTDIWNVELLQSKPLFELKFPRFAYRWKYYDNQFSTISPFTEVAFLPTIFQYDAKKGYNKGMTNTVRLITLSGFDTPPVDAVALEILYKETNNSAIYVVDDVVFAEDPNFTSFEISSELIYKIIQSNQLLRPWDNVPKKALAQEIVGNRLVYGNYLQNYTLNNSVKFKSCALLSDGAADIYNPKPSIKSLRTYQVGVVFKDEYGRETPVFTDSSGIVKTTLSDGYTPTKISVQAGETSADYLSIAPWATHFKYFIKEPSGEYYNIAADRIYNSADGTNIWISFPSSERNKVAEDSYLILKKGHESNVPVQSTENRYKILSISNEAPLELTKKKALVGTHTIRFDTSFGELNPLSAGDAAIAGSTPVEGNKSICIAKLDGNNGIKLNYQENFAIGNYIRFATVSGSSYYKITSVLYDDAGDPEAKIFFDRPFQGDINLLYSTDLNGNQFLLRDEDVIEVYKDDLSDNKPEFFGRFFCKLEKNQLLKDNLFLSTDLITKTSNLMQSAYLPSTFYQYGYPTSATNIRIWGGGVPSVITGSNPGPYGVFSYNGGYRPATNGNQADNPEWAQGAGDPKWDVIIEKKNNNRYDPSFIAAIQTVGTQVQFDNAVSGTITNPGAVGTSQIYTIQEVRSYVVNDKTRYYIIFEEDLQEIINPIYLHSNNASFPGVNLWHSVTMRILEVDEDPSFSSDNPAIFETEPKESIDLNIYYEASDALPVSQYHIEQTLDYHNVFTYGNGVESNRIRDDFNAPFIDKGTKASTVLEDPYEEERRATGLIYSGIYNSNSGLNNLNQFIQAEKITKDLNPVYGSIQKLHTRDTNLVTLCEDKILRILANKDALFNADGNANLTSTNNVLGQAVPFNGEFGISKNPESFASYGYRAYFSDKKRGVVLRLSMDGLTEISSKGMTDYFYDNLKAATTVLGSYDIYSDAYTLTLNNDTVCFKESLDGWPTRKSFIPEWGISLNSDYYTFKNGMIWSHDNENRNTFYEGSTAKSSVQLIFNDSPNKIKNFKTISYEGDSGWIAPLIKTDQQDGAVTTFLNKENIYYNYIRGLGDSWNNPAQSGTLDLKQFAAQGIGNIISAKNADNTGDYTGNTTFTVTVKNDPLN